MSTLLKRLPMTKRIRTVLAEASSKPVGKAGVPKDEEGALVNPPYFIVYPLWTSTSGPPFGDPHADVEWVYQITCVSADGDQLEWLRDKALEVFLARTPDGYATSLEIEGMHLMSRELVEDSGDVTGTDSESGIMSSDLRFALKVTPTD